MSSDTVYMGGLTEERYVNPLTHGILMHAFKWAMDGVSDYLPPEQQGWLRREPGGVRGDVKQQTLDVQRKRMANIVLCSASENRKSKEIASFLDHCQDESGTGSVMSLVLLDGLWSLPAFIRPVVGDQVVVEVYDALRRYGVLTKFGALKPPATQIPTVPEEKYTDSQRESRSSVASSVIWVYRVWSTVFVLAATVLGFSGLGIDLPVTGVCWYVLGTMLLDSVCLDDALFAELQHCIVPALRERAAYHESGHFLLSYLLGCPISVCTIGGWASIRHGKSLGSEPFVSCIDPELSMMERPQWPQRKAWRELSGDEMGQVLWRIVQDDWEPWTETPPVEVGLNSIASKSGSASRRETGRAYGGNQVGEGKRRTVSYRFALLAMAGAAAETIVTGFEIGGRGDRESLRITLLRVWPTVSGADLTNTETWALSEDLRILTAERKALNILAKNMLETKQIGCLVVELERALAELSTECS